MEPFAKEIAKMALMIFFTSLKTAGKSVEEMEELYKQYKEEFFKRDPVDFPDV